MGGLLYLKGQIVLPCHFVMKTRSSVWLSNILSSKGSTIQYPRDRLWMDKVCQVKIFKPNLHLACCVFLFPLLLHQNLFLLKHITVTLKTPCYNDTSFNYTSTLVMGGGSGDGGW